MAKILIKSAKLTPFSGIFSIMEQFDSLCAAFVIILISIYYMSSDSFKEIFVITVYYFPRSIFPASFFIDKGLNTFRPSDFKYLFLVIGCRFIDQCLNIDS